MRFVPHTPDDIREMLAAVGVREIDDLFADIPQVLRATAALSLPGGLSEQEVVARLESLNARNLGAAVPCFLGGGAYPHFVPAVVDSILQRAEFYSAYTPYQPEVSQGTLQAVFEFQTLVAMLFDLEIANASMYDGASATAEAVLMALRVQRGRERVILARSLHPDYRQVTRTYVTGVANVELIEAPFGEDGRVDLAWLAENASRNTAAVVVGYPNFFGVLENLQRLDEIVRQVGTMLVTATAEPLALALVKAPGSFGVEIAVGEGQSFGIPLQYGGPGVGLFATRTRHVRSMPGRLVGEAADESGRRGYVLTLATREQHIRRERATSNICTNHGLMALAATVYLSLLGKHGLRRLAAVNLDRAHNARDRLCSGGRWRPRFSGPFFNEFALAGEDARAALDRAKAAGLLAGLPLGHWYPELDDSILLAVTETHSAAAIERLVAALV
jgi:glycine dehydrogenase subunit 1